MQEGNSHSFWLTKCECGNEKIVSSNQLKMGRTRSCGCLKHPCGNKNPRWKGYGEIPARYIYGIKRHSNLPKRTYKVSLKYLWKLFLKQNRRCVYSGEVLKFKFNKGDQTATASLDRIDSSKGYVKGNVQWVHKKINVLKSDFSEKEFLELCKQVTNYQIEQAKLQSEEESD